MKNFMYGAITSFAATSIAHVAAVDFGMKLPPAMIALIIVGSIALAVVVNAVEES